MVTGRWRTHKYSHIPFLHICVWAFTDFTQWPWIRCALKKEKDYDFCESELVQALWEWPTSSCYFLRGIHKITRKWFLKETDVIWMLAKKKLASLQMVVRRRGRVIPTVFSLGWVAAWGMLCAVTEQAAPNCQTLPPLRYLPLKINHPLFTEAAGISLSDSDGQQRM